MIGYVSRTIGFASRYFTGESSGWSNTQTITIPETYASASPSPNPTPTPTVPEFVWLIILPLFLSILSFVVLIRKRKVSWVNVNNL